MRSKNLTSRRAVHGEPQEPDRSCYRPAVRPTWLVLLVLLACTIQTTEALTFFTPDDCATVAGGAADEDDCQNACARCICCARRAPTVVAHVTGVPLERTGGRLIPFEARIGRPTPPRDVFHVPKTALLF